MSSAVAEQAYISPSGDAADDVLRDKSLPVGERFDRAREVILDEITTLSADVATLGEDAAQSQVKRIEALSRSLMELESEGQGGIRVMDTCHDLKAADSDWSWKGVMKRPESKKGSPEIVQAIVESGLNNASVSRQEIAIRALGKMQSVEAARELVKFGLNGVDGEICLESVEALGKQPSDVLKAIAEMPEMRSMRLLSKVLHEVVDIIAERRAEQLSSVVNRIRDFVSRLSPIDNKLWTLPEPTASWSDLEARFSLAQQLDLGKALDLLIEKEALVPVFNRDPLTGMQMPSYRPSPLKDSMANFLSKLRELES